MILVQNHLKVKKEYAEAFENAFRNSAHSVDGFPGFVRNEVLRPIKGEEYIVAAYWATMDDFKRWMGSDQFRKAHSGGKLPSEAFNGESRITIHETI
ncbi:MAG: hypothetical protein B2I17_08350 [Thermoplasmatales archaeon B_DKE]|nr:MAG: hypothetical protein B2I17_08350 [Thermoplasmatales archaeon B_DKE]